MPPNFCGSPTLVYSLATLEIPGDCFTNADPQFYLRNSDLEGTVWTWEYAFKPLSKQFL